MIYEIFPLPPSSISRSLPSTLSWHKWSAFNIYQTFLWPMIIYILWRESLGLLPIDSFFQYNANSVRGRDRGKHKYANEIVGSAIIITDYPTIPISLSQLTFSSLNHNYNCNYVIVTMLTFYRWWEGEEKRDHHILPTFSNQQLKSQNIKYRLFLYLNDATYCIWIHKITIYMMHIERGGAPILDVI